jgi:hypothetical protein
MIESQIQLLIQDHVDIHYGGLIYQYIFDFNITPNCLVILDKKNDLEIIIHKNKHLIKIRTKDQFIRTREAYNYMDILYSVRTRKDMFFLFYPKSGQNETMSAITIYERNKTIDEILK